MYNCIIKAKQFLICQNKSSIKGFRLLLVHFHARNYFTFQLTETLRVRVQHYQKKGHLRTKNSVFYLETPHSSQLWKIQPAPRGDEPLFWQHWKVIWENRSITRREDNVGYCCVHVCVWVQHLWKNMNFRDTCCFIREGKGSCTVFIAIILRHRNDSPTVSQLIPPPPDTQTRIAEIISKESSTSVLKNG